MSFWESSNDVTLEQRDDGHYLKARCQNGDGEWCDTELNLDSYLGNNNGEFERGSGGFSQSAELVRLEGPEVVCLLRNNDGGMNEVRINLNDFVGNDNGNLFIAA